MHNDELNGLAKQHRSLELVVEDVFIEEAVHQNFKPYFPVMITKSKVSNEVLNTFSVRKSKKNKIKKELKKRTCYHREKI